MSYILLTAAKNEGEYIEYAIRSVLGQTVLPRVWWIMDDGSTDTTAEIVSDYARTNPFIRLGSVRGELERKHSAQHRALNQAFLSARSWPSDFVGVQDADIAVQGDAYYERLMMAFSDDERLGISGGVIYERAKGQWKARQSNSADSVPGGSMMFRRPCFEEIGGYVPMPFGGADWRAQIEAKRRAWAVRPLLDLVAHHYRPTASAGGRLRGIFRQGMKDGSFGSHPVFELAKCLRRFPHSPIVLGSLLLFAGYSWWGITRRSCLLPKETEAFLRGEQMRKVRDFADLQRAATRRCSS